MRKVARRSFSTAMAFDWQKLAMGQQHPQFLAAQRLYMDRPVKPHPHHLRHAAGITGRLRCDLVLRCEPRRRTKNETGAARAAADQAPGIGKTGITSTASPGKIVKCG